MGKSKITAAERDRIRKKYGAKGFACPPSGYPIDIPKRVVSARAYYPRPRTRKCPGGKKRICAAAKKFGLLKPGYKGSAGWKKWCRR